MAKVYLMPYPISSPIKTIVLGLNDCLLMCIVTVVALILIDFGED